MELFEILLCFVLDFVVNFCLSVQFVFDVTLSFIKSVGFEHDTSELNT